jgi:hypothetical protein
MKGGKCRPSPRPPRLAELDAEDEKALARARGGREDHDGAAGDRAAEGDVLEVPVSSDAEAAIERAWAEVQERNEVSPGDPEEKPRAPR